jgi:hypothetical protein
MLSVLALLAGVAVGYALALSRTAATKARLHAAELALAQQRAGDAELARVLQALATLV